MQYFCFTEEARRKALGLYRFLAFIQLLLGMGLLGGGRKGSIYSGDSFGPPFYLGGFIVGPLVFIYVFYFCILLDVSLTVKAATLIFISGCGSAI